MKRLHEKLPAVIEDLKKRAGREYALGHLDKQQFDEFCDLADRMIEIAKEAKKVS